MCKRQISTILILAILLGDCGLQCPPSSNITLHSHLRPMASAISGSAEGIKGSSAGSEEKTAVGVSAQKRAEEQDFAIFVMHNIYEGLVDTSVERQTLLLRSTTAAIFIELIIKNHHS